MAFKICIILKMPIIPNLFVYLNTTSGSMPYECTVLKVISYYVSELSDMTSFTTYYLKVGTYSSSE